MSFGVRCEGCGLEYAGARGLSAACRRPGMLTGPRYLRMLVEVRRFHRHARRVLADPAADGMTLGEFLRQGGYSRYFADHFMLPLTGAVWSSSPAHDARVPGPLPDPLLREPRHADGTGSPQWRTVTGGSREYVRAIPQRPRRPRPGLDPGVAIERDADGRRRDERRTAASTGVVIATHADQALRLLADPSAAEREVLGGFALLEQRDGAAHRRLDPAAGGRRARLVELPARRLRREPADRCT